MFFLPFFHGNASNNPIRYSISQQSVSYVANWELDAGSGTDLTDSSGNGHNGTIDVGSGSVHWSTLLTGSAIELEDSEDQALQFGDNNNFSFTSGGGNDDPFSTAFWVKHESLDNFQYYLTKGESTTVEWFTGVSNLGSIRFKLEESIMDSITGSSSNTEIIANNTYYLAFTYNGNNTAEGMKIYKNGSLLSISYSNSNYNGMSNTNAQIEFGRITGLSTDFDGVVDQIRLWDIELSSSDILDAFNDATGVATTTAPSTRIIDPDDDPRVPITTTETNITNTTIIPAVFGVNGEDINFSHVMLGIGVVSISVVLIRSRRVR